MPEQEDLTTVHDVLEEAFTDHFNYHFEPFDEFCSRLREDPGHRWDHWWIAELVDGSNPAPRPAGVLVATVSPGHDDAPAGSYVAYLFGADFATTAGLNHDIALDLARPT